MKKQKKLISLVLAALMAISMMPISAISAFATEWSDEYVSIEDIQQGDTITTNVSIILSFEDYEVTLPAGGYHRSVSGAAENSDWVGKDVSCYYGAVDTYYLPYDGNGPSNKWYVLAVDHDAMTITLSGLESAPAQSVSYKAASVNATTHEVTFTDASCDDYTVVTASTTTFEDGKWYVV
ncbi:MAG: hypothetical protein IJ851_05015, partial [Eubacterium sp.]|nr:hypothetical protein [Eubacterium sp.]